MWSPNRYSWVRRSSSDFTSASRGVPTARIEADFIAPSRLGDKVLFSLHITKIGRSSIALTITGRLGAETRMHAHLTLVWVDGGSSAPWPDDMRARLTTYMESQDAP